MRTLKEIFTEAIQKKEMMIEGAKQDIEKLFSGDKEYEKLKKAAKSNSDKEIDLVIHIGKKEKELEAILKKYKISPEEIVKELV